MSSVFPRHTLSSLPGKLILKRLKLLHIQLSFCSCVKIHKKGKQTKGKQGLNHFVFRILALECLKSHNTYYTTQYLPLVSGAVIPFNVTRVQIQPLHHNHREYVTCVNHSIDFIHFKANKNTEIRALSINSLPLEIIPSMKHPLI